jgi:predicted nucleic acid-binding protein
MGVRQTIFGKRVYMDTMIFIYLMEGYSKLEAQLLEIRDSFLNKEAEFFTSDLTLCEVLVIPFKLNNEIMIAQYRNFIEQSGAIGLRSITRATYVQAAVFRAQFGLKTPDAVHVSSAVETGCNIFLTNDKPIKVPESIKIVLLKDM